MNVDLVIKNGKVVSEGSIMEAAVFVKDGKIVGISRGDVLPEAKKVIDVAGKYVLPGVIDLHVHFRDPGQTYKEDFSTGSAAAAAGGVTTVFDMPNNKPPITTVNALKEKIAMAEEKSYVDFALFGGVAQDALDQIPSVAKGGVIGFKVLMGFSVITTPFTDDAKLLEAFRLVGEAGLPMSVHAENEDLITAATERLKSQGRMDPLAHLESRPSIAEAEAVGRAIILGREAGSKIHIVHLSSKEGVELIRMARSKGLHVTAETCPQYLLLEKGHMNKVGSIVKINPPVRTEEDSKALWAGIHDGTIDAVATDHSPHTPEEKMNKDIWKAASGFVGVETSVPLMLTKVNEGALKLIDYARISSERPAKIFNIYPQKGTIKINSDADFTIVDMEKEGEIKSSNLHSKTKVTPFDGWRVRGIPIYTIVRGNIVMEQGKIVGKPIGRFVRPAI